jgi:hypothetical protein
MSKMRGRGNIFRIVRVTLSSVENYSVTLSSGITTAVAAAVEKLSKAKLTSLPMSKPTWTYQPPFPHQTEVTQKDKLLQPDIIDC